MYGSTRQLYCTDCAGFYRVYRCTVLVQSVSARIVANRISALFRAHTSTVHLFGVTRNIQRATKVAERREGVGARARAQIRVRRIEVHRDTPSVAAHAEAQLKRRAHALGGRAPELVLGGRGDGAAWCATGGDCCACGPCM